MVQKYTFTYSRVCGIDIELDIYLPDPQNARTVGVTAIPERSGTPAAISSVVFFHGGDLTWGSRKILPEQLKGMMILGLSFHPSSRLHHLSSCVISIQEFPGISLPSFFVRLSYNR